MNSNEIISEIMTSYMRQRNDLIKQIAELNCNEGSHFDRKSNLEYSISNIDNQINLLLTNIDRTSS